MPTLARRAVAEMIGTAILVFFAVGSAVFGIDIISRLGVALAFGLVLLALAYSIGPLSGAHVNPAVTLGVLLSKGITVVEAGAYWVAQFIGGIIGAAVIQLLLSVGKVTDQTGAKGSNNWNDKISVGGSFILEILLTAFFVLVILLVTHKSFATPGFAGLAIGLTLTAVHLVGIPLDGTSVNPARSLGPALFAGGAALSHVWVFILAPLIGAALATLLAPLMRTPGSGLSDSAGSDSAGSDSGDQTGATPDRGRSTAGGSGRQTGARDQTGAAPSRPWSRKR